jgi:hypothetical protein
MLHAALTQTIRSWTGGISDDRIRKTLQSYLFMVTEQGLRNTVSVLSVVGSRL